MMLTGEGLDDRREREAANRKEIAILDFGSLAAALEIRA